MAQTFGADSSSQSTSVQPITNALPAAAMSGEPNVAAAVSAGDPGIATVQYCICCEKMQSWEETEVI